MSGESRLEDALGLYGEGARAEPRRSPFKFLDAYERDDRDIFFGRDAEIEDVRSRYYRSRVVTVYGESGAGKTSLVQCGLANAVPAEDADFIAVRSNVDPLQSARTQLGA
ncbi:MAG: ATP-binding protein, partial [Deltaproteobacteria bacterium]|nr:ATP-binding protein [Deltaproteobacteria bacterium]